ncbi:unnamed protein product [Blepharisma stoltei]|uniref:Peptidase C1A papain C-terminal domain-containing protein n=1 Tax=Blepharisma stoltei TaxID=1481888 RepID=A0AAU9KA53_9CILI|nr:unnamed protein product [Blepharisma stoltei]
MKLSLLSILVACVLSGPASLRKSSHPLLTQKDIDFINQSQNLWTASLDWIDTMTLEEFKIYASVQPRAREFPEFNWGAILENLQIPSAFDSRTQWPGCIHPILNQELCGGCWAFGATEALSDRFCIASNSTVNAILSPQYLIDCNTANGGCNGGWPDVAWNFMMTNGVPTSQCVMFKDRNEKCPSTCDNGSQLQFYKASSVNQFNGPSAIQAAILSGGPVETTFTVYADFGAYKGGIYSPTTNQIVGYHAVKIVGWGNQNGTNY